jgi:hypothetical protein
MEEEAKKCKRRQKEYVWIKLVSFHVLSPKDWGKK